VIYVLALPAAYPGCGDNDRGEERRPVHDTQVLQGKGNPKAPRVYYTADLSGLVRSQVNHRWPGDHGVESRRPSPTSTRPLREAAEEAGKPKQASSATVRCPRRRSQRQRTTSSAATAQGHERGGNPVAAPWREPSTGFARMPENGQTSVLMGKQRDVIPCAGTGQEGTSAGGAP